MQAKIYWQIGLLKKALVRLDERGKAARGKIAVVLKEGRTGKQSPGVVESKKVEELGR